MNVPNSANLIKLKSCWEGSLNAEFNETPPQCQNTLLILKDENRSFCVQQDVALVKF